ncbi:hypothetical protein AB0I66_42820 [Streptomyces sp. NPDC050439]|uniref:hypothetical protein n=1 Tax=unclassified Streptomyces TaxID=2593676 RepID=UPI003416F4B3
MITVLGLPAAVVLVLGIGALLCWVTIGTTPWMVRWSLGRRALDKSAPENQAEVVRAAIGEASADGPTEELALPNPPDSGPGRS